MKRDEQIEAMLKLGTALSVSFIPPNFEAAFLWRNATDDDAWMISGTYADAVSLALVRRRKLDAARQER